MPSSAKPTSLPPSARDRPLTVLQVVPSLETGGAERTAVDIAAALAARGDRALVASEGGRLAAELAEAGGVLVPLPAASKSPLTMLANARRLARLIRAERVDIVHARSRAPAWSALLAARMTGIPFLTTFHGSYGERNALKRFYNSVMARGDIVIANSRYTAELIATRYGTPAAQIVVVPRGTDTERFSADAVSEARRQTLRDAWQLAAGEKLVLQLARLTGWKGQSVMIEAAAQPPLQGRRDFAVALAGDAQGRTEYVRALEQSIAAHDLNGRVRLVGHCDDTPAALSLADVAVIASTEPEAFGRTAIEAAAMGVPVVATTLGATAETVIAPPGHIAEERTGWLVPPGDAAALSAAIGEALGLSGEARQALGARARSHALRFTTEAMQAATLAVYDRLAPQRGNDPSGS